MSDDDDRESEFESADSDDDNDGNGEGGSHGSDGPSIAGVIRRADAILELRPSDNPLIGLPVVSVVDVREGDGAGASSGVSTSVVHESIIAVDTSDVDVADLCSAGGATTLKKLTITSEQPASTSHKNDGDDDNLKESIVRKDVGWEVDDDDDDEVNTGAIDRERCTSTVQAGATTEAKGVDVDVPSVETPTTITVAADDKRSTDLFDKLSDAADGEKGSSWGWSSWGASVLSTASSSMATFTSQFEQGLNTVLETVESSLGAPSPEELVASQQINRSLVANDTEDEEEKLIVNSDQEYEPESDVNLIESLVSGVSSSFTNKVISGGLDTLELIGRKTMDILQDGDPGLKKKRALLNRDKPCLSEVLREAKEKAVQSSSTDTDNSAKTRVHFGTIFDDRQGFVHLEALEMLSKLIEQKVQLELLNLTGDELSAVQGELKRMENDCVLDVADDDDNVVGAADAICNDAAAFADKLADNFKKFNAPVNLDKLVKVQVGGHSWLLCCQDEQDKRESSKDAEEIHERAITFLAEFTAKTIEILHKTSELILVSESHEDDDSLNILSGFVNACCAEISLQSSRYSACLNTAADDSENPDCVTPLITNVYLEASNSETYIQDAFRLLVPIFQLIFLERKTPGQE